MMLRTSEGYLDFNEEVILERQALLFEELSETRGDFSYSFTLPYTHNNLAKLGCPFPDNASKLVYQNISCDLLSESGNTVYQGFLRVERVRRNDGIDCSFFSGNSNWLSMLTGDMTELNLSAYDRDITESEIQASWLDDSGIVFPLIDTGALINRSYANVVEEDFVGCFYLKTLMMEVFKQSGLKLDGELINDPLYNSIVIATNTRSKVDVDNHSLYLGKNDNQVIPPTLTLEDVTLNVSSTPYFIGSDISFTSDIEFTSPSDIVADVSFAFIATGVISMRLRLDGATVSGSVVSTDNGSCNAKNLFIRAGQVLKVTAINGALSPYTITSGSLRITPQFVYKAFGRSCVPLWTKIDFVKNVLSTFNCITGYDPYSKTVTINLFEKIKSKEAVDISSYIDTDSIEVDYVDFISNYGQNSNLSYQPSEEEDLSEYNISSFVKYGTGVIQVANDFLSKSEDIFESEFTAPISYLNPVFDASFERINFVELEDVDDSEITSVSNSGGFPRFNVSNEIFEEDDIVFIESTEETYNGYWLVIAVGSGYIQVQGLLYNGSATGNITLVQHKFTTDDSVYMFVNTKEQNVPDLSSKSTWYFNTVAVNDFAIAFFNMLQNNTAINDVFKQGLSFGEVTDPLSFQRNLIQTYWGVASRVLNDPVKIIFTAYLPETVYNQLSPLTPVYIKSEDTVNMYYLNKDSGYNGPTYPCELELIKLP